jgi:type I restriction enzyme S subunit
MRISKVVVDTDFVDPTKNADEEFLYVDISSIDNKKGRIIDCKRLKGSEAPSRARKRIRENDIIVSTVRPNLNATALVPKELDNQVCSTGFCVLRSNGQVIPDYLYYYTRTSVFIKSLMTKAKGASYPAVSVEDVKQVEIPVFSIEDQRRIVSALKIAYGLIRRREQANQMTNKLLQTSFLQMFGDPAKNPKNWKIGELEDVCDEVVVSFVGTVSSSFRNEGVLFLRTTNVKPSRIDLTDVKHVSSSFHLKNKKSQIKSGDILMTRVGLVGQTAIVPSEIHEAHAGNVIIIRLKSDVNKKFYETLLNSSFIQNQIYQGRVGGVQQVFNTKSAMRLKVIIPPSQVQEEYSRVVEKYENLRLNQQKSTNGIDSLFSSLMSQAFKGELASKISS